MKYLLLVLIIISSLCYGQKVNYKEYSICLTEKEHKGKKNHGKCYCVTDATVREYKDGRKDTTAWYMSGETYIGDEYEKYQQLSERNKYIVDSLKEDGITQLSHNYLAYEPMYMKNGRRVESLWDIENKKVKIYKYLIWKNKNGNGVELIKEIDVQ